VDHGDALTRWNRELAAWQRRADGWLDDLEAKGRTVAKDLDAARSSARTKGTT
jgi:hypothetical protein